MCSYNLTFQPFDQNGATYLPPQVCRALLLYPRKNTQPWPSKKPLVHGMVPAVVRLVDVTCGVIPNRQQRLAVRGPVCVKEYDAGVLKAPMHKLVEVVAAEAGVDPATSGLAAATEGTRARMQGEETSQRSQDRDRLTHIAARSAAINGDACVDTDASMLSEDSHRLRLIGALKSASAASDSSISWIGSSVEVFCSAARSMMLAGTLRREGNE